MIRIKDDQEFDLLLESLASDVVSAHVHYKLFRDLDKAKAEFARELNESWTFWWLTILAHRDCTLLHLGRIYDQTKGALSLRNWLQTIQRYQGIFDERNFRQRLKGNKFVDSLAATARRPDETVLARDIERVNCKHPSVDPAVKKLVALRNKRLAHRSPDTFLPSMGPITLDTLSWQEVEHLLALAARLTNHYSSLFKAVSHSTTMVGYDDYIHVLQAVREGLQRHEEAIAKQLADAYSAEERPP